MSTPSDVINISTTSPQSINLSAESSTGSQQSKQSSDSSEVKLEFLKPEPTEPYDNKKQNKFECVARIPIDLNQAKSMRSPYVEVEFNCQNNIKLEQAIPLKLHMHRLQKHNLTNANLLCYVAWDESNNTAKLETSLVAAQNDKENELVYESEKIPADQLVFDDFIQSGNASHIVKDLQVVSNWKLDENETKYAGTVKELRYKAEGKRSLGCLKKIQLNDLKFATMSTSNTSSHKENMTELLGKYQYGRITRYKAMTSKPILEVVFVKEVNKKNNKSDYFKIQEITKIKKEKVDDRFSDRETELSEAFKKLKQKKLNVSKSAKLQSLLNKIKESEMKMLDLEADYQFFCKKLTENDSDDNIPANFYHRFSGLDRAISFVRGLPNADHYAQSDLDRRLNNAIVEAKKHKNNLEVSLKELNVKLWRGEIARQEGIKRIDSYMQSINPGDETKLNLRKNLESLHDAYFNYVTINRYEDFEVPIEAFQTQIPDWLVKGLTALKEDLDQKLTSSTASSTDSSTNPYNDTVKSSFTNILNYLNSKKEAAGKPNKDHEEKHDINDDFKNVISFLSGVNVEEKQDT